MSDGQGLRSRLLNSTTLVFVAIILLLIVWISSGMIGRDNAVPPERDPPAPPSVAASWSEAEPVTREITLYGDVRPNQVVVLRARTDGIVEEMTAVGAQLERGEVAGRLSTDDREARLTRAQARLTSAQRDYDSALELVEREFVSRSEVQARRAELEAARAELRAIEQEIANTTLRAPIDGVVNRIVSDLGAYVGLGGEVLEIVDNDPLLAVVHVQQGAVSRLRPGMDARIRFIGGEERQGNIRFIAPIADATTRTFRVEIEIPNREQALPSGLSAEVIIPTDTVDAHRVSAALIRLDDQGRTVLQTVDADDRIAFTPVQVIKARADGLWVTGLGDRARLVTISRGLLSPGQAVEVRETPEAYLQPAQGGR
ncbi:MAG: efflux RND transporter periplasmic adaptor subunit [Ectothiorhodospiraceae bacterium]|nr:efflux RND transporter periplasmic adaptor subunit [Ectothiorhodospiraceae bacterium]